MTQTGIPMAAWQFDFHLVPATEVLDRTAVQPVTISAADYDQMAWWRGFDGIDALRRDISALLPRRRSWSANIATWGDEDGDRIDLSHEGREAVEVFGRIDVRHLSLQFVQGHCRSCSDTRAAVCHRGSPCASTVRARVAGGNSSVANLRVRA